MSRKLHSQSWTGDYPAEAHFPLASPQGRRRHLTISVAILGAAAAAIGGLYLAGVIG